MTKLAWDQSGQRYYETGVDHGVLYTPNALGVYANGYAWNGLVSVTESPSGAESNKQYADNIVYLNLQSAEEFNATVEAFTYPDEFGQCDGTAEPESGVTIGQQARKTFGMAYRTRFGNDLVGPDYGYKIHLIYGALASPSEKPYTTINDSPEAIAFSWEVSTTPVTVGEIGGVEYKPTASLTVNSTTADATALALLEDTLYGTAGTDPSLPTPAEVIAMFAGTITEVTPVAPTFVTETNTITIPTVTGVEYRIDGVVVTGTVVITVDTVVTANATAGYRFPVVVDDDWFFGYTAP